MCDHRRARTAAELTVAWDDEDFAVLRAEGSRYTEGLRRHWVAKLNRLYPDKRNLWS